MQLECKHEFVFYKIYLMTTVHVRGDNQLYLYEVCLFSCVVMACFTDPGVVWQLLARLVHVLAEPTIQTHKRNKTYVFQDVH